MEVKGTAIVATLDYVRARHGDDGYRRVLEAVTPAARQMIKGVVLPSTWYPIGPALFEPTQAVCDLFHGGDPRGAWEVGRASAESALTGIYKALLVFVSPRTVVERGPGILSNYYRPLKIEVKQIDTSKFRLEMALDEPSPVFDRRVAGWAERALEMAGAKDLAVDIVRSAASGAPHTEIHFVWR
jgi:hypothetical protein